MALVTMSRANYESLLAAAQGDTSVDVTNLAAAIDSANGIRRYVLNVRWYEVGGQPPPRFSIADGWPQNQTFKLVLDRPITRQDVDLILQTQATNPADPYVTSDPEGAVGWTSLDDWNFSANSS